VYFLKILCFLKHNKQLNICTRSKQPLIAHHEHLFVWTLKFFTIKGLQPIALCNITLLSPLYLAEGVEASKVEKKAEQPSDTAFSSPYALTQTVYDSPSNESLTGEALKFSVCRHLKHLCM